MGTHSLVNLYSVLHYLQVPLKYVCVTSERKAALIEQKFAGVKATTQIDELLNDEEIAGVFVAASPTAQYGLSKRVLESGKALFVEKPPCQSLEELDELVALKQTKGVEVACAGLQKRYAPSVQLLRQRLRKEKLVSYNLHYRTGAYPEGNAWLDLYIHPVDLATHLFGAAEVVAREQVGTRSWLMMLRHEGVAGVLELSTDYTWTDAEEALTICTQKGAYRLTQMEELTYEQKHPVLLGIPMEKVRPRGKMVEQLWGRNNFTPILLHNQVYSQGFYNEVKAFVDAVEHGGTMLTDLATLRETYRIILT
jgi:virulence factor